MSGLGKRLQQIISDNGITSDTLKELNYLVPRICDLVVEDGGYGQMIFLANIETVLNCSSIKEVINLTFMENINFKIFFRSLVQKIMANTWLCNFYKMNMRKHQINPRLVVAVGLFDAYTAFVVNVKRIVRLLEPEMV